MAAEADATFVALARGEANMRLSDYQRATERVTVAAKVWGAFQPGTVADGVALDALSEKVHRASEARGAYIAARAAYRLLCNLTGTTPDPDVMGQGVE